MAVPWCDIINNVILGKDCYCCLCFKTVGADALLLHDEVVCDSRTLSSEKIEEILRRILDCESFNSLKSSYTLICPECWKEVLGAYKFVKRCRENYLHLTKALNSISNSLSETNKTTYKSVFVDFNSINFASTLYWDAERVSEENALKKYKVLKNVKQDTGQQSARFDSEDVCPVSTLTNEKDDGIISPIEIVMKKQTKICKIKRTKIPTSEMRIDDAEFKCKKCLKSFPSSQHLRQHYIRVHAPKKCKCPKCPRSYGSESILKQHEYDSHTPVMCSECGKRYENRHSLKMHEMGHNTKITCPNCGRTYKHQKSFNRHIAKNTCRLKRRRSYAEAKFMCDHCSKRFTHKGSLRVHIQFEHGNGKSHVCSWCNKKFYAQSRLKAHIVKHTKEKQFCCNWCGGKFVTKESLVYHTRIHTGERPYQCHLCERQFISSSRRAEHVRRHHLNLSLECEICHCKFKGKSCLAKHRKRHFNPESRLHSTEKHCK